MIRCSRVIQKHNFMQVPSSNSNTSETSRQMLTEWIQRLGRRKSPSPKHLCKRRACLASVYCLTLHKTCNSKTSNTANSICDANHERNMNLTRASSRQNEDKEHLRRTYAINLTLNSTPDGDCLLCQGFYLVEPRLGRSVTARWGCCCLGRCLDHCSAA